MPRHSTFQLFSDTTTKVVNDHNAGSDAGPVKGKVVTEKVINVMGSTAGAGSSEFHLYVSARNREIFRIEDIEERKKREEEEEAYIKKVEQNKREADERTAKNAEKRKRKREKEKEKSAALKVKKAMKTEVDGGESLKADDP
eukprot:gene25429-33975_t